MTCLHKCPVCDYVAESQDVLYGHVVTKHFKLMGYYGNKKENPAYQCWCRQLVSRRKNLSTHLARINATLERHYYEYLLGVNVDVP